MESECSSSYLWPYVVCVWNCFYSIRLNKCTYIWFLGSFYLHMLTFDPFLFQTCLWGQRWAPSWCLLDTWIKEQNHSHWQEFRQKKARWSMQSYFVWNILVLKLHLSIILACVVKYSINQDVLCSFVSICLGEESNKSPVHVTILPDSMLDPFLHLIFNDKSYLARSTIS